LIYNSYVKTVGVIPLTFLRDEKHTAFAIYGVFENKTVCKKDSDLVVTFER